MARYTGPKHKLARREGVNILDKQSASFTAQTESPSGRSWEKKDVVDFPEFGSQLREKQKAKATYGLLEKQFRRMVDLVSKQKGDTGEMLLALLETRLDNVVYRLGFAKTRFMSRQVVSHGHVRVNGEKVSIPSYQVQVNDVVSLSPKMEQNVQVLQLAKDKPPLLSFLDREGLSGKIVRAPKRDDIEVLFNTQQIIEYYSR